MPIRTVYKAQIDYLQILDEEGKLDEKLAKSGEMLTDDQVVFAYDFMIQCRQLDEIAFKLQRSGRMGTYPQNKGQEAAAIGSAMAAVKGRDFLCPCYRENAALFLHGLPMEKILLHWMGDERGNQIPAVAWEEGGGGGAGFLSSGASGGTGASSFGPSGMPGGSSGSAGAANGSSSLFPLRGGCSGGVGGTSSGGVPGAGGGAVQISSLP